MITSETVHRGRIAGTAIGASIKTACCEAVGLQPDHPGVHLRGFTFVGEAPDDCLPDVEFEIVERTPEWWT